MNGNWESSEIFTASAVLPLLGGPEGDEVAKTRWINSVKASGDAGSCALTLQQHRHQRRSVAVLCLLNQQLAVLQHHRHWVPPGDDPVHKVAGVVLLIGAIRLDRKTQTPQQEVSFSGCI